MKNRLVNLAKILISVALLTLLFSMFDVRQSWAALRSIKPGYFALAFVLFQATLLLRSYRWRFLLDAVGVPVPIRRLLYLYYVGVFFNTFLPSGFGGDAVKMIELASYSRKGSESVGTVLVDRLAGIVMLFIMGLVAWPFAHASLPARESYVLLAASVVGLAGTFILFQRKLADVLLKPFPARLRSKLQGLYDAVHACGTGALWKALAVSALFNAALFTLNYCIALAMDVHISYLYFIVFMPILSLSMLIPSLGALGTREGAYVMLFGTAGVPEPVAIAMSLAFYLVNVLTGVIGGLLYLIGAATGMRSRADKTSQN